jgi:hypothetical protein
MVPDFTIFGIVVAAMLVFMLVLYLRRWRPNLADFAAISWSR